MMDVLPSSLISKSRRCILNKVRHKLGQYSIKDVAIIVEKKTKMWLLDLMFSVCFVFVCFVLYHCIYCGNPAFDCKIQYIIYLSLVQISEAPQRIRKTDKMLNFVVGPSAHACRLGREIPQHQQPQQWCACGTMANRRAATTRVRNTMRRLSRENIDASSCIIYICGRLGCSIIFRSESAASSHYCRLQLERTQRSESSNQCCLPAGGRESKLPRFPDLVVLVENVTYRGSSCILQHSGGMLIYCDVYVWSVPDSISADSHPHPSLALTEKKRWRDLQGPRSDPRASINQSVSQSLFIVVWVIKITAWFIKVQVLTTEQDSFRLMQEGERNEGKSIAHLCSCSEN